MKHGGMGGLRTPDTRRVPAPLPHAHKRCLRAAGDAQDVFQNGYGSLLDSGTTFSYFPTPAFDGFVAAVTAFAVARGLKSTPGPDASVRGVRGVAAAGCSVAWGVWRARCGRPGGRSRAGFNSPRHLPAAPQVQDVCFEGAPHYRDVEGLAAVFPTMQLQFDGVRRGRWDGTSKVRLGVQ